MIRHTAEVRVKSVEKIICLVAETQKLQIWDNVIKIEYLLGAAVTAAEKPHLTIGCRRDAAWYWHVSAVTEGRGRETFALLLSGFGLRNSSYLQ